MTPASTSVAPESRLLAAIVFTDVAGFSARMQVEEASVLQFLERDFAVMRGLAQELSGTVLKTTGDGLLLYFTSAVQAVTWALQTQRHFATEAKARPRAEILRHRVGVHVGDVYVRRDDVMGDGVNIAARVQAEAPPGGICISQTVYEVVKNKLELHVVRLEPRKLKNIREIIPMYHVLLQEPVRPQPPAPVPPAARPVASRSDAAEPRSRRVLWSSLALVAVAVGSFFMVERFFAHERDLLESQRQQAELEALLKQRRRSAETAAPQPIVGDAATEEFDFLALTTDRSADAGGSPTAERALRQASESVGALEAWLMAELARYNRDAALVVRSLREGRDLQVYLERERVHVAQGANRMNGDWASLGREVRGAIIVSALRASAAPAPRSVVRGAEAFAFLHGLPALADALRREPRASGSRRP